MHKPQQILQRISFLANAEFLVGCAFFVSGVILVWNGAEKLRLLYDEFAHYFPLTLADETAQILLHSFPLIFKTFINTVGSICAVLMGLLWGLGGIGEALEGRKKWAEAPDLEKPEEVAESLRSAQSLYWQAMSFPIRILARLVRRARFISPITYDMFHNIFTSVCKICLVGILIALTVYLLGLVPALADKYLHWKIRLVVPSAGPLYWILALLLIADGLIAVSLLPFRKPEYARDCETIPVCGSGDPHLFFALLEEGCRLLSAQGPARNSPFRVERRDNPAIKGTLIESFPKGIPSLARPAGYLCLPLVPVLLSSGFSRLTDFSPQISSIHYTEFLSLHVLFYALDVALALALILAGVYFGEWARKLLGVRRFQSAIVFCSVVAEKGMGPMRSAYSSRKGSGISRLPHWRLAEQMDEAFAQWAKNPDTQRDFLVEICWAEAISEAASEDGPRYLTDMRQTEVLRDSMRRLTQLPFHVDLVPALCGEPSPPAAGPRPQEPSSKGDVPTSDES